MVEMSAMGGDGPDGMDNIMDHYGLSRLSKIRREISVKVESFKGITRYDWRDG